MGAGESCQQTVRSQQDSSRLVPTELAVDLATFAKTGRGIIESPPEEARVTVCPRRDARARQRVRRP